jgi:hypothetical protein
MIATQALARVIRPARTSDFLQVGHPPQSGVVRAEPSRLSLNSITNARLRVPRSTSMHTSLAIRHSQQKALRFEILDHRLRAITNVIAPRLRIELPGNRLIEDIVIGLGQAVLVGPVSEVRVQAGAVGRWSRGSGGTSDYQGRANDQCQHDSRTPQCRNDPHGALHPRDRQQAAAVCT